MDAFLPALAAFAVPLMLVSPAAASNGPAPDPATTVQDYLTAVDVMLMPGPHAGATAGRGGAVTNMSASSFYAPGSTTRRRLGGYEVARAQGFHDWVAAHGDIYRSITTTLQNPTVDVSGSAARVTGDAVTTMLWTLAARTQPSPAMSAEKARSMREASRRGLVFGPGDTVDTKVATTHTFKLVNVDGAWKITQDRYLDPLNVGLAADHETPVPAPPDPGNAAAGPPEAPVGGSLIKPESATAASAGVVTYRRGDAVTYADEHWDSYNPNYIDYNPYGGDCANFVSQSLWDPNGAHLPSAGSYWGYFGGTDPTAASPVAWRYTPSQHQFFINNPQGSTFDFGWLGEEGSYATTSTYDKDNMLLGDVLFYDWHSDGVIDHTAIVAAYLSDGSSLVDAHNTDHYRARYDLGFSDTTYYLDRMHDDISFK